MRLFAFILASVVLSTIVLAGDEKAPEKPKPPPAPPGIWWAKEFDAGRAQAMREGRPVLFAINALETEQANNRLALEAYTSVAWGTATRGYVAFVCNPNDHRADGATSCSRYPGIACDVHKAALLWFTKRFGESLISPQHVILEPDGDVAFRKEYYTGVVGPALLESYLAKIAPRIAYSRAGIGRGPQIKGLRAVPVEELDAKAGSWLASGDGLAAAGIVNALDDSTDGACRRALIRGLRRTPDLQVPVLVHAAEERVLYPTDAPDETLLWIATLFAADRSAGVWAATRALVRIEDASERDKILRTWAGTTPEAAAPAVGDLPEDERAFAYEALLLAGDRRAGAPPETAADDRALEIERAQRKAGRTTAARIDLAALFKKGAAAGILRRSLVRADPADVRAAATLVVEALLTSLSERVRIAAAFALLRAQLPQGGLVVTTILAALDDPLEGRDAREQALQILGDDPGTSRDMWRTALTAHVEGGAK